jgi:hypothetical protein
LASPSLTRDSHIGIVAPAMGTDESLMPIGNGKSLGAVSFGHFGGISVKLMAAFPAPSKAMWLPKGRHHTIRRTWAAATFPKGHRRAVLGQTLRNAASKGYVAQTLDRDQGGARCLNLLPRSIGPCAPLRSREKPDETETKLWLTFLGKIIGMALINSCRMAGRAYYQILDL